MKLDPKTPQQDNQVIAAEQRQVKTETKVSTLSIHPGHTMFEFDLTTGLINVAQVEKVQVKIQDASTPKGYYSGPKASAVVSKKIIQRDNCLYASALNKKNAIKKFAGLYEANVLAGNIIRPAAIQPIDNLFEKADNEQQPESTN